MLRLAAEQWRALAAAHAERADLLTAGRRERSRLGRKDPVEDFVYVYYGVRPAELRRWHPGAGVELADAGSDARAAWRWYTTGSDPDSLTVDADALRREKSVLLDAVRRLLRATTGHPATFGCFGLHEWAMVYRQDEHRHPVPLRLGQAGTDAVVEAHELRCTHYDAFRFFSPDAAPRNQLQPTRERQASLEQPGCLHAGMDLFKWALKLGPLVQGDLLLDTFEFALDVRRLDMEASPYDARAWGGVPVPVETPEGKAEYVGRQRDFSRRGAGLRARLLDLL